MRLLVCGSREWRDKEAIHRVISLLHRKVEPITLLIEGECSGADVMSKLAAVKLGIPYRGYPADWDRYGKAAGPTRNQQMLDEGKPDFIIAFHENIAQSAGTKDMLERARRAKIPTMLYTAYNQFLSHFVDNSSIS